VYQYHTPQKKLHPIVPSITLVLKYIFNFSNFVTNIILSWIYFVCSNSSMFVDFFKNFNRWSQTNKIYLKQEKNSPKCDVHAFPKKIITKRLYSWLQFWGGFVCFHPLRTFGPLTIIDSWCRGKFNKLKLCLMLQILLSRWWELNVCYRSK
jgi:hypothetical protein